MSDENKIEKRINGLYIAIYPDTQTAIIQRHSMKESIEFHLESQFFNEAGYQAPNGFQIQKVENGVEISDNGDGYLRLTDDEMGQINRFFMRYRQNLLV